MTDRLVTNDGRRALRQFLIENIDEMSVGVGTADPHSGDEELDDEVFRADVSNEATATGQMQSRLRLGVADANDQQLTEAMLHIGDDSFCRIVFDATEKTEDIELAFEIEISANNEEQ